MKEINLPEAIIEISKKIGVHAPKNGEDIYSKSYLNRILRAVDDKLEKIESLEKLKAFSVYHDKYDKEYLSVVYAEDMLEASKLVDGKVNHVKLSGNIDTEKGVKTYSGWCKRIKTPTYSEPSEEWKDYLKSIHLGSGLEN
jgi:hypothetical protein